MLHKEILLSKKEPEEARLIFQKEMELKITKVQSVERQVQSQVRSRKKNI